MVNFKKRVHMSNNMIKLSVAAAVAVAGLSTTSSASKLEDAIKNTELSGFVRYRFTDGSSDNPAKDKNETNEYKTVFNVKSKVNDMVTANVKVAGADSTTDASGDADPVQTNVKHANFIFDTGAVKITAGKQGLVSPFGDSADQQGTGIVAVAPLGAINLHGAWYTNSDGKAFGDRIDGKNITALGVSGKASIVDFSLWAAQLSESTPESNATDGIGATGINLNVKAAITPMVTVELNHAQMAYSGDNVPDDFTQQQSRVVGIISAGPIKAKIGVVKTGDEGGDATFGDSDAQANFQLDEISAHKTIDSTIFYFAASMNVGPVVVGAEHLTTDDIDGTTNDEKDALETRVSVKYPMSKNFTVSAFMSQSEVNDNNDTTEDTWTKSRIEMKYTF